MELTQHAFAKGQPIDPEVRAPFLSPRPISFIRSWTYNPKSTWMVWRWLL